MRLTLQCAAFATLLAASFSLASAKDEKITLTPPRKFLP